MINPVELEEAYQDFLEDLPQAAPDGIIEVNLSLLNELGLLNCEELADEQAEEEFPHHFHVIETQEKVTLFSEQFAIWIVPKVIEEIPTTLTLICLIQDEQPHLEIVFSTSGIYNTPKFVLKILRHYLSEVVETEEAISSIGQADE